jgi:hypothetical protein
VLIGYRNGTQVLGYVVFAEGFGQTGGDQLVPAGLRRCGVDRAVPARARSSAAANFVVTRRERKYMA